MELRERADVSAGATKSLEEQLRILQDDLQERFSTLRTAQQQASNRLSAVAGSVETLENKACDRIEMLQVKDGLAKVSQNVREKETAVLFGARCLSCNRVFDDVRPEANAVDLAGERQRHQVFAEVQRVLNDPAGDFSKPVRMVSVKVGKPAVGRSNTDGAGSFQTRESGFGNPLDDMHLMLHGVRREEGGMRPTTSDAAMQSPRFWGQGPAKESRSDYKQSVSKLVGRRPVAQLSSADPPQLSTTR